MFWFFGSICRIRPARLPLLGSAILVLSLLSLSVEGIAASADYTPSTWKSYLPEANSRAKLSQDDITCGRLVDSLVSQPEREKEAFAQMVACALAGKYSDLRLMMVSPWRKYLTSLGELSQYKLIASVVARRGGRPHYDIGEIRYRGIFLYTLGEAIAVEEPDSKVQYVLTRAQVNNIEMEPDGQYLSLQENFAATTYFSRGGSFNAETGRRLMARSYRPLQTVRRDKSYLFLLRIVHLSKKKAEDDGYQATIYAAYPLGDLKIEVSRRLRDRGVDIEPPNIVHYQLKNGLKVVLHPDSQLPLVSVNLSYDVGADRETAGKYGLAHLLEHLMFQGSAHVKRGQHFGLLQQGGGFEINATTSFDLTSYMETVPSQELELALWLEADRMAFLKPSLSDESLQREKRVVINELRERVYDQPYGSITQSIHRKVFPRQHPYSGGVIGTEAEINAISLADVHSFYDRYYHPSNATLVLAGDFEVEAAKRLIEKYFSTIPAGKKARSLDFPNLKLAGPQIVVERAAVARLPRVSLIWQGPSNYAGGAAELDIAAFLLTDRGGGFLRERLEQIKLLVHEVNAYYLEREGGSTFEVHVVLGRDTETKTIKREVLSALYLLRRYSLSEEQMAALAKVMERSAMFSSQTLSQRARLLQQLNHYAGGPDRLIPFLERYHKATTNSLQAALRKYLNQDHLQVIAQPGTALRRAK